MVNIIYGIITAALACLDLWCKSYVEKNISKREEKSVLKDKVSIRKAYNEGMMLNFGDKYSKAIRILSAIVCGILGVFSVLEWKNGISPWKKLGASFALAGAVSNTYDRLAKKHVVDYFGFRTKWKKFNRITFNLGDVCIFLGSMILLAAEIFGSEQ